MKTKEMFKELYENIDKKATKITFEKEGENVMKYPCGFAAIFFPKKLFKDNDFVK